MRISEGSVRGDQHAALPAPKNKSSQSPSSFRYSLAREPFKDGKPGREAPSH